MAMRVLTFHSLQEIATSASEPLKSSTEVEKAGSPGRRVGKEMMMMTTSLTLNQQPNKQQLLWKEKRDLLP
jgi:hypothetical protein